ncbi:spermidine synthase [Novosphingobium kaempferiae]|uniref:spermidine synthase n=1 Tax=Novosphingobium kaempferiae TaxID=2896849 RepID=UPI001E55A8D1|nr:fused MFS/spermidine synthase [Novosphingobium kaempferiae]
MTQQTDETATPASARRGLFVATILVGSFLLFLVQPMVARMALPRLGGAPNVWNSAMLVYQALLLAGYAYAHWLGRFTLKRQAMVHVALLLIAALTLPVGLADLPRVSGLPEALWVPLLLAASIGPVFFVVSAQAPLMQRWFAASPSAGAPWALYAASNLGSFAGLIAYPLLAEPLLSVRMQSLAWSCGFAVLVVLVALAGASRRDAPAPVVQAGSAERIPGRTIALWLLLSAVPSGLMLSTTTHLTTDIFAMPLLWVIPLGLYLLSFVVAFADRRGPAHLVSRIAPVVVLCAGSFAMLSNGSGTLWMVGGTCLLLFCVASSLHARLYDLRPAEGQLTRFYLTMSAGGALGGMFTALIAPLVFDWAWEHPLLVLAAALLMPLEPLLNWQDPDRTDPAMRRIALVLLLLFALFLGWQLADSVLDDDAALFVMMLTVFLVGTGIMVMGWRWAFALVLLIAMVGQGGLWTIRATLEGERTRSYFGIYTLRDNAEGTLRTLAHGTTLHGMQSLEPGHAHDALTYYGPTSGVALALAATPAIEGPRARVGVVGLGTGSLACRSQPGQAWTFFEIDPVILRYSTERKFTFLGDCTPKARVVIGDARLELAKIAPRSFDVLVIDAFSSDAIPMHLLTAEAMQVYRRALTPRGLLMLHISNRYIDLAPVVGANARATGLAALSRLDFPEDEVRYTPSRWIALSADAVVLDRLARSQPDSPWKTLEERAPEPWTDDHASILPHVRWSRLTGNP